MISARAVAVIRRIIPDRLLVRLEPYGRRLYGYVLRSWTFAMRPFALLPGRIGPPRHVEHSPRRLAELEGVDLQLRQPGCVLSHPVPAGAADLNIQFVRQQRPSLDPTYVLTLNSGRVCGEDAAVIGPRDTLFTDVANRFITHRAGYPILRRFLLPPIRHLAGDVAVVATAFADFYYHWMTEILPRFMILGDAVDRVDRVVTQCSKPFQTESLGRLGIGADRIVSPGARAHYQADRLIVPSLAGIMNHVRPESLHFVRDLFGVAPVEHPPRPGRRLYVSRRHDFRRRVTNEPEVIDRLGSIGFESLDPGRLTVAEQASVFAEAEMVVGPHGGGLTNILFCAPGTTVLEIFTPGSLPLCYWALASSARLSYDLVVGRAADPRDVNAPAQAQWRDIDVDCEELSRHVESLMEKSA